MLAAVLETEHAAAHPVGHRPYTVSTTQSFTLKLTRETGHTTGNPIVGMLSASPTA